MDAKTLLAEIEKSINDKSEVRIKTEVLSDIYMEMSDDEKRALKIRMLLGGKPDLNNPLTWMEWLYGVCEESGWDFRENSQDSSILIWKRETEAQ